MLDVIQEEHLCDRSAALGERLMDRLNNAQRTNDRIAQVRGQGSMVAVEFRHAGQPDAATAKAVQQRAHAQGLVLLTCGMHGNVIRFLYPLTIPDAQFERALDILDAALTEAVPA